jgi:hypothetical protein
MENLGAIDINIREFRGMGGGVPGPGPGGGGGQPGGGPRPIAPAPNIPSPTRLDQLLKLSDITGEIRSFVTGPTVAGFAGLMQGSGATATALAGLGAAGAALVPVIGAVILAGAGVYAGFKALQRSAEITAQRIDAVGRYSMAVVSAQVVERVRALQRNLREAAENGRMYARAQMAATRAADATFEVQLQLNKAYAIGAEIYHNLVAATMRLVYPFARFVGMIADAVSALGTFISALGVDTSEVIARAVMVPVTAFLDSLIGFKSGFGPFSMIRDFLVQILKQLGIIGNNTRPPTTVGANDWFTSDVQAITGSSYRRIGKGVGAMGFNTPQGR